MTDVEEPLREALTDARRLLEASSSRKEFFRRTLERLCALCDADACGLYVVESGELVQRRVVTASGSVDSDPALARSVAQQTFESGEPLVIDDLTGDERFDVESDYRSILSVPLGEHGVVQIAHRDSDAFDDEALVLGLVFGGYVSTLLAHNGEMPSLVTSDVATDFLEITEALVVVVDTDGRITFANRNVRETLGYDEGDLQGRNWFETCLPERVRGPARADFERRTEGDELVDERFERPVLTSEGDERIVEWNTALVRNEGGSIGGLLYSGLDATARSELERLRQEEHGKYRTLVEQFPNGLVTLFDEEHRFQVVGGTGLDELGIDAADIEGRRLEEVFPPENVAHLAPLYDRAFEGESSTIEVPLYDRVFRIRIVPVRDEDGAVFAGMTISQDVTEEMERKEELEAAKKRYRTLLRTAPDPIFLADAQSGDILEVNDAAVDLRGQPRDEILDLHVTDLHPVERSDEYGELFKERLEEGGTYRWLPDGSQMYAVSASGERIPVEISCGTVDIGGETITYGIFRDISDRLDYERALTAVTEATRAIGAATRRPEMARRAARTVTNLVTRSVAAVYLFDEEDGVLQPAARDAAAGIESTAFGSEEGPPDESTLWQVFVDEDPSTYRAENPPDDGSGSGEPIRHGLVEPLGESGVMVVGTADESIGAQERQLLDMLVAGLETALQRAERERRLETRERQLRKRNRKLEAIESFNAQIRKVSRALVDSESQEEIERAVCTHLVHTEPFDFALVGTMDPVDDAFMPRAWAGEHNGYLDQLPALLEAEGATEPSLETARTGEETVISNTATDLSTESWRSEAITRGFRSVMSIPIAYHGTPQGVLTVYSETKDAFSESIQSLLVELGDLIAHAVVAVDRKQALLSNRATELEFEIQDRSCFFLQFAQNTNSVLELETIVPRDDGTSEILVTVRQASRKRLLEEAKTAPSIARARPVEANGDPLVQLEFTEPYIATKLADQGMRVRNIAADSSKCRVTVAVPPTLDVRRAVETVTETYPGSDLVAKRERKSPSDSNESLTNHLLEGLTTRQRDVIETAYRMGYFDSPKRASGQEIADELGLSSSTFHQHVRAAERKLFETLLAEYSNDLTDSSRSL